MHLHYGTPRKSLWFAFLKIITAKRKLIKGNVVFQYGKLRASLTSHMEVGLPVGRNAKGSERKTQPVHATKPLAQIVCAIGKNKSD